jgi:hypothetical protein
MKSKISVLALFAMILNIRGADQAYGQPGYQNLAGDSGPLGDWRGQSICVVRESACHDEDSLYHVTKLPDKPGWYSIKLDKIVEGKPVTMGTMDCAYGVGKQTLTCEFPRGVMRFTIAGDKMIGTMTLPDGTLWRKLSLKKTAQ